jgi:hypothetical protein
MLFPSIRLGILALAVDLLGEEPFPGCKASMRSAIGLKAIGVQQNT